jgi:hypothetical protein
LKNLAPEGEKGFEKVIRKGPWVLRTDTCVFLAFPLPPEQESPTNAGTRNFSSWNQLDGWLPQIEGLRRMPNPSGRCRLILGNPDAATPSNPHTERYQADKTADGPRSSSP